MSRRVSQSFTLSFAELRFILSNFCGTLRFISEPLRENRNNFDQTLPVVRWFAVCLKT